MAHELDKNTATGRLAYFGVKQAAWHNEGFTIDTPPSLTEALRLSGADYDVALRPLFYAGSAGTLQSPAVEVIDHNTDLYRVRGSRVSSMSDGTMVDLKTSVLQALVAIK